MNYVLATHQKTRCFQQTTLNKTTDNNFRTHYILHFIFAHGKFLRLDTTFFLHKPKDKFN